jgi:hypothetical protein
VWEIVWTFAFQARKFLPRRCCRILFDGFELQFGLIFFEERSKIVGFRQ